MQIDPETHDRSLYRTLTSAVVPRPVGWISTTDSDGVDNLAPYSFFNVAGIDPPVLMYVPGRTRAGELKDSARNVIETGEFVHNVVDRGLAEAMNETSATLPAEESEFDHADVECEPAERVAPPRVAEAPVAFECELYDTVEIGLSTVVLGEVVLVHADESVVTEAGKLDVERIETVGRLAGSWYAETDDRFRMERPD